MTRRDLGAAAFVAVAATGSLVRLTLRDSHPATTFVYYAFPWIVIAVLFAPAALVWLRRRPRASLAAAAASVVCAALWLGSAWFHDACAPGRGPTRVLFWNVGRGHAGWREIAESMREVDADLIGLVEAGEAREARMQFWRREFPGFQVLLPGAELVLLSKDRIVRSAFHDLSGGYAVEAELEHEGGHLRVVLVDVVSLPVRGRRRVITGAARLAELEPRLPTIVMGDFNTPIDSVWFEPLRRRLHHAFESAGSGILATWPAPLPIVALDHVFLSHPLQASCADLRLTGYSDHLQVVVDLGLARP